MSFTGRPKISSGEYARAQERKDKAAKVMDAFLKTCYKCGAKSSQRPIVVDQEGRHVCNLCIPDGYTIDELKAMKEADDRRIEESANKPKPEGFGDWG